DITDDIAAVQLGRTTDTVVLELRLRDGDTIGIQAHAAPEQLRRLPWTSPGDDTVPLDALCGLFGLMRELGTHVPAWSSHATRRPADALPATLDHTIVPGELMTGPASTEPDAALTLIGAPLHAPPPSE